MSTVTTNFGSSATSLAVTALNGLANAAFWKSASINFSTNSPVSVIFQVSLTTQGGGAGSATGYANVFMACSHDGSTWDSTISAGDATWSSTNPTTVEYSKSLQLLGRMSMGTTQTANYVWTKTFLIPAGEVPKYAVIVVENECNKTLAASGCTVTYLENGYSVA